MDEANRLKIEEEILKIIEEKLSAGEMDVVRAKEIAKLVLNSLKTNITFNQLHQVVQNFDDYFPELASVVLGINGEYDEKVNQAVSQHAGKLIGEGKLNEARNLMKQALDKQIKLPD